MAQYTAIFTKPYEDGYENLPSQNTPITAQTLNDKDDAIVNIETYLSRNDIPSDAEGLSYDNTDSGLTADNVQGAVDELADEKIDKTGVDVKTNATGQFNTITGGLMQSCEVDLELVQDLHGYSKPWTGGSGKNLLPLVLADIKSNNTSGTWSGNTYTMNNGTFIVDTDNDGNVTGIRVGQKPTGSNMFLNLGNRMSLKNGTAYILNANGGDSASYIVVEGEGASARAWGTTDTTYTPSADVTKYIQFVCRTDTTITASLKPIVRTSGNSTFEPYTNICPISGHTSVDVGCCGKNKFSGVESGGIDTTTGQNTSMSNTYRSTSYIPLENGDSYTFSGLLSSSSVIRIFYYDEDKNYISTNTVSGTNNIISSTISVANTKYIRFHASSSVMTDTTEVQLEEGSQATEYEPYNGYTTTINLGGTYYGGILDAVSGVLTVTHALVDLGTLSWTKNTQSSAIDRYYATLTNGKVGQQTVVANIKCSGFEPVSMATLNSGVTDAVAIHHVSGDAWISTTVGKYSDANAFKSAVNGVQLVYELATPIIIQLDPQTLETLVGQNDVFAPLVGQTLDSLTYREVMAWDDVERAVAVKLDLSSVAPIEYTDKASQSYNQKQLFIKDNKLCQALASISSGASFTENTNFKYTTLAEIIEPLIP